MKIKLKNILLISAILTGVIPLGISCSSQQNEKKVDETKANETNDSSNEVSNE
ncbi:hypothetical protein [Mycoplasma sp. CSL7503-lung]|uniref:hypothetical protein n=1 Tax=Mycoplasma sp. CSL7503-lung TaxID=536372 RepID=UPI0021CF53CB|nr:hypothetical protein [Mycoplasma sp. CSL7503-lung]MCU4706753.1 hypothetical protein [Mycoplasma sp. CSL7503-lung]